jgi:hypothetical protein
MAILQELGAPPLNALKRTLLATLLLDPRFEPLWGKWILETSDDLCRKSGIRALRAHAGKELFPDWEFRQLLVPEKKPGALQQIRRVIEQNLARSAADARTP